MHGLGRRVSILALVVVAATAMLGAVYTLWYENLTLTTSVSAGTLDGKIVCGTGVADNDGIDVTNDGIGDLVIADIEGYPNPIPLKDIGTAFGAQVTPPAFPPGDPHNYIITVSDAYPGYAIDCELELRNIGGVPWHVETVQLTVLKNGIEIVGTLTCTGTPIIIGNCTWGDISPTTGGPGHSDVYFELANDPRGCQVHSGLKFATSMIIGINQNASEGATYQFILKYQINQWNESNWISCHVDNPAFTGPVLP